jgi:hypothetical protein
VGLCPLFFELNFANVYWAWSGSSEMCTSASWLTFSRLAQPFFGLKLEFKLMDVSFLLFPSLVQDLVSRSWGILWLFQQQHVQRVYIGEEGRVQKRAQSCLSPRMWSERLSLKNAGSVAVNCSAHTHNNDAVLPLFCQGGLWLCTLLPLRTKVIATVQTARRKSLCHGLKSRHGCVLCVFSFKKPAR